MVRRAAPLAALAALASATACGDADIGSPAATDAATGGGAGDGGATSDAGGEPIDGGATGCLPAVPVDYGSPSIALARSASDGDHLVYGDLVEEPFQRIFISLHAGTGAFAGAVVPGTYAIEGAEADYAWCGACVYLAVDDGDGPSTLYMARSGKVTIDSVGATVHGQVEGVDLRQIEIAYAGETCGGGGAWPCGNAACSGGRCGIQVEDGGCETHLATLTF